MSKKYTDINADTIDHWVEGGWEWSIPITHEAFERAKQGDWQVVLTPKIPVPKEWFAPHLRGGRLDGVKLLGLACGGGQQMPVFAALGADATVLDYSTRQLGREAEVSEREGYAINMVRADMSLRLPFEDEQFDLIFHPVSNCYVEDVRHVWRECFRVLKKGGVLLAGMDNGFSYMFDEESDTPLTLKRKLPYNPLKDPALMKEALQNDDGVQFSHSIEEQIGGQLLAGFRLTDLREDYSTWGALCEYFPVFLLTRAIKD